MGRKGRGKGKSLSRKDVLELVRLATAILVLIKALVDLFAS